MKWFSFIPIFAIMYTVTFNTLDALFHLLNFPMDIMKKQATKLNALLESTS